MLASIERVADAYASHAMRLKIFSSQLCRLRRHFSISLVGMLVRNARTSWGKPIGVAGYMMEELQYIYSMFLKSPVLVPPLGEFDYEFSNLTGSTADARQWVEKRLYNSV
jgi:hypothetical protein